MPTKNFGSAALEQEGTISLRDESGNEQVFTYTKYIEKYGMLPEPRTCYLERKVPLDLLNEIDLLIDKYLEEHAPKGWND